MKMAVAWGLEHRSLEGVSAIGVDEISRGRGQKYATLVYQIDAGAKRLLWVGKDRTTKTLLRFFKEEVAVHGRPPAVALMDLQEGKVPGRLLPGCRARGAAGGGIPGARA